MARCRPARLGDVPAIHALIATFAERELMLARSHAELYETIRDFVVAVDDDDAVLGCAALHIANRRIAELKSLAVASLAQGQGIGRALVEACHGEALELGLERVFCLTYQTEFFAALGYTRVDRSRLPEKVWGECVRCNRFLSCDEVALWVAVGEGAASA